MSKSSEALAGEIKLHRVEEFLWEIPRQGGMRVPGRIFATEKLLADLKEDNSLRQVMNVAHLPGIVGYSLAMPDIHWGYGFPIGGVAAMELNEGVISPGGVGYDINCGVRLVTTHLTYSTIQRKMAGLIETLFSLIPSGVGSEGAIPGLSKTEEKRLLRDGAVWAVAQGYGHQQDLDHMEEGGALPNANPELLSDRALARGLKQVGTLGSGNHFLEIGRVEEIYLSPVASAANYAWANRQVIMSQAEKGFLKALDISPAELGFSLIYDVCHNIAKIEEHVVDGQRRRLCVHRKGATRAFPPGHPQVPKAYQGIGQPVLVPGDMGRYSYLLVGCQAAMEKSFGSTCHGAGRVMSRTQSKKESRGINIDQEMARRGVVARYQGRGTMAEEMPHAYKDVAEVVETMDLAGISKKVARFRPVGVIKG